MSYPKEFARHFIGVGGIVIHEKKVLLVQLTYGRAQRQWLIPGGFLELGETLREGVIREIYEETTLTVEVEGVLGVRSMVRVRDNITDLYCVLKCRLTSNPELISPQIGEISKVAWISLEDIQNDSTVLNYTKNIVNRALKDKPMQLENPLTEHIKIRFDLKKYEHFWVVNTEE